MARKELKNEYFDWMCDLIYNKGVWKGQSYDLLLRDLNEIEFTYSDVMDANRYGDGINLRYRFGDERNYDQRFIASELDIYPCSILEMMVALALRCEEQIMSDSEIGDRTKWWFWGMIASLGLIQQDDDHYSYRTVSTVITRFLSRDYNADGSGSLFMIPGFRGDMRSLDIWYQMCMYLDTI